jgi:DNA-directed RNA polymerase specialized sigma24 family protein
VERDHFEALLSTLDADSERSAVAYRQLHQRLIRFFRLNNASDPEALADEALDRLAARIAATPLESISSPQAFALGVARHLLQEDARRQRRDGEVASEWASQYLADNGHQEDLLQALDHCMALMREDQRQLLSSYYQWIGQQKIEHHRELAQKLGLTMNAMRNRVMRARVELDKCLHKRCSDVFGAKDTKNRRQ